VPHRAVDSAEPREIGGSANVLSRYVVGLGDGRDAVGTRTHTTGTRSHTAL
jgi:hypothetical protein